MNVPSRKSNHSRAVQTLVAGVLAALPLLATLWLFSLGFSLLFSWVGPGSAIGRTLGSLGVGLSGHEWTGYVAGVAIALLLLFALGVLVKRGLAAWFGSVLDAVVGRIPIVRTVYETVEKFVEIVAQRDESAFKSMRPVWCHFGDDSSVAVLALLSSSQPVLVDGRACFVVIVPTAPIPIGGGLLFVPVERIRPAAIGMEALTSIYVSMGVTAPEFLPRAPVRGDV